MTLKKNSKDFDGCRTVGRKGEPGGGLNPQCGGRALTRERIKMEHLYFTVVWI